MSLVSRARKDSSIKIQIAFKHLPILIGLMSLSFGVVAQGKAGDTIKYLTLDQCIMYALQNQPALMQAQINVSVAKTTNDINLSGWLPQANINAPFTHYFQLPTSFIANQTTPGGEPVPTRTGIYNTFIPQLAVTETLFSPEVLYAATSAHLYVKQAEQSLDSTKIGLVSSVSKSFYSLLLTLEQINVLNEDTARLAKNLRDTYHQYVGGLVDKTDYKEATITLNNSMAQLKQAKENVRPQYAQLKMLMGFTPEKQFSVSFDTARMVQEIAFDTTQQLKYENRIEYQQLETVKSIQHQTINYYRFSILPTLSAFYDYNYEYENNSFSDLFKQAYPNSYIGAGISIPIFTGFKRLESLHRAKLQEEQINWGEVNLKANIYSEYATALTNYKSNMYDLHVLQDNVSMGKDVYSVVSLQYKQGIVPYLNVITAESDLISSEINYLNALFQVLSSKVDLEKAMGFISSNR